MMGTWRAFVNHQPRHIWRVVALGAILVGPVASGADDDIDDPVEGVQKVPVVTEDSTVDQFIFEENLGQIRIRSGKAATTRKRINLQLNEKLFEIWEVCELNEAQMQKLSLAARGDITRFFDRVEQVRRKYLEAKNDQNRMNEIWPEISSLRQQLARGLFGNKSMFAKTLRRTLTEEQQANYQAMLLDQRRTRYKAAIEETLCKIGDGIVLSPEQIEALQKLLLEQTQPPLLFGQDDRSVVMLRLSQLPRTKLKEVLGKSHWKSLQLQLLLGSGHEDTLVQNGVIEEPKPTAPVIVRSVRTVIDGPVTAPAVTAPSDAVKPE